MPFLSQASTCALESLRGRGTPLPNGPGCECYPLRPRPVCFSMWAPELLTAMLCCVKCWEWERWAWIQIKFLRVGNGVLCQRQ